MYSFKIVDKYNIIVVEFTAQDVYFCNLFFVSTLG